MSISLEHLAELDGVTGYQDASIAKFEAAFACYPQGQEPEQWLSGYLSRLQFAPSSTPEKLYRQHLKYGERYRSADPFTTWTNSPLQGRRLRLAYTCHFCTATTSMTLLWPLLKAHNRERVEVFMYCDEAEGFPTAHIEPLVEHWRMTRGMDTEAFCKQLRDDGIDVLVELNGHGAWNRYHVIGRHSVPVQVAWYNYATTSGVPGMDYCLISEEIDIDSLQPFYSEKIFRKRGGNHALLVGDHFPPVTPQPFERNGYVTFCSFGQAHKVTREQVLVWCRIMRSVRGSRFFMKANVLDCDVGRAMFTQHFADGGIDATRLRLEGNSPYDELLTRCYGEVDIALDTFPANAGTTTIESLIMGVPVVTQAGDTYASQLGKSIMVGAQHPELITPTCEEYIGLAIRLAESPSDLKNYRATLRDDFKASRRCDIVRFVRELEDAYIEMFAERQTLEITLE